MNKLENKLSSREVADMMEIRHPDILRKIEGINRDFTESKIAFSKYWTESSYKDASGKSNREFMVTKRGCEFLAHKTTGTKGNLFTDRYMDKFAEMEKFIEYGPQRKLTPMEIMELQFKISKEQEEKLIEITGRVEKIENNSTIDYSQQIELNDLAKFTVVAALGGKDTPAYKELGKKAFSQIWKDFKRVMQVNSYRNTPIGDLDRAKDFIKGWKPCRELELMIIGSNSQVRFNEVI